MLCFLPCTGIKMRLTLQKMLLSCTQKKTIIPFTDITVFPVSPLPYSVFYFFTHFEIVTKFLQLLCVFMILSLSDNVNIFIAYSLTLIRFLSFFFSLILAFSLLQFSFPQNSKTEQSCKRYRNSFRQPRCCIM